MYCYVYHYFLFYLCLLAIVLFVLLRIKASAYPFGILNLFVMVLTEMMLLVSVDEMNTMSLKINYGDETYRKVKDFF